MKSNRSNDTFAQPPDPNPSTVLPGSGIMSSSAAAAAASAANTTTSSNIQYAVFCSSKQARVNFKRISMKSNNFVRFQVVSLPSQVCFSKQKIDESLGASASNFLRAAVVKIAGLIEQCFLCYSKTLFLFSLGSACLTCFQSGNRIQIFSLPSLRQVYVVNLEITVDSLR